MNTSTCALVTCTLNYYITMLPKWNGHFPPHTSTLYVLYFIIQFFIVNSYSPFACHHRNTYVLSQFNIILNEVTVLIVFCIYLAIFAIFLLFFIIWHLVNAVSEKSLWKVPSRVEVCFVSPKLFYILFKRSTQPSLMPELLTLTVDLNDGVLGFHSLRSLPRMFTYFWCNL